MIKLLICFTGLFFQQETKCVKVKCIDRQVLFDCGDYIYTAKVKFYNLDDSTNIDILMKCPKEVLGDYDPERIYYFNIGYDKQELAYIYESKCER